MDASVPPVGYIARRLQLSDAGRVAAVVAACEEHDVGEVLVEEADVVGDWQRPGFDLATCAVGLEHDGEVVAYVEIYGARRAEGHVLPRHRGHGLGTWLAAWSRDAARRDGGVVVGQGVLQGSSADLLLTSLGYEVRWTSWVLELPEPAVLAEHPLPAGCTLRDLSLDDEHDQRRAFQVIEDAFAEWPERQPIAFDDWAATSVRRPGFAPGHLRLAVDGSDAVLGACLRVPSNGTTYVDQLAVRRQARGLGLARALLADAFALGRAAGGVRSELSTDSRTGALGLYERLGMSVQSTWVHRAIDL